MESVDSPLRYIPRIREYYLALGYQTPYRWARNASVPFAPLRKRLSVCRVAIVTTAAPFKAGAGEQGPGAPYNGTAKFFSVYEMPCDPPPELHISHIAYDRQHTTATDSNSFFPLRSLQKLEGEAVIGEVCEYFFGLPTNRSHRTSIDRDCPDLIDLMHKRSVDACVLVPNCPVCHQSVGLAAAQLEAAGITTVVMGCARDIVEFVGVPRFLFSDFPLGNSAGRPHDTASQDETLLMAMNLLEAASEPRTTLQSPQQWGEDSRWKEDYCNIEKLSEVELRQRRLEFDAQKQRAKKG